MARCELPDVSRALVNTAVPCLGVGVALNVSNVRESALMRCEGQISLKVDSGSAFEVTVLGTNSWLGWNQKP